MAPDPGDGLRVAILGPILVAGPDGTWVEPAGALGKNLIVTLALSHGAAASVRTIVDDIWHDRPPKHERAALQTLISRVRTTIADGLLESTAGGYALAVETWQTDLGRAAGLRDRAREAARGGDDVRVEELVGDALELWRGEPGIDVLAPALAHELSARAADVRIDLLRLRAASRERLGDAAAALDDLITLEAMSPFDEDVQAALIRTLAASGRRAEALAKFATFRASLRDELGTDPGAQVVSAHADVLRGEPAPAIPPRAGATSIPPGEREVDAPAATTGARSALSTHSAIAPTTRAADAGSPPAPSTLTATSSRRRQIGLRAPQTRLIGRDDEVRQIEASVGRSRVTTILGPGGLGKTRVAQELGHRSAGFALVVFVELASVRTDEDVTLAIASTLGIREARSMRARAGDPSAALDLRSRILIALSEQDTLLIIDNCEHVIDAAAAWVADILDSTATVRILTTSRAPLAIAAEQVFPLRPLASSTGLAAASTQVACSRTGIEVAGGTGIEVAGGHGVEVAGRTDPLDDGAVAPAVALFIERALAARPNAVLPLDVVARLCDRLDGLPLAIELAAARTRSMSIDEIERRLSNRFSLLTGGERTAPERHRTLIAVIDWSWNLLTRSQQSMLRRLCRFVDGFSAEAAETVVGGDTSSFADDLDALVMQSLVSVSESSSSGALRYRMLETVREFGDIQLEQAGEEALVRDRTFAWSRAFGSSELHGLLGVDQLTAMQRITAEQDNLVAALRSAIAANDAQTVLIVFALLAYYWTMRSAHTEVIAFGASVIDATRAYEPTDQAEIECAAAAYIVIGATCLPSDVRTSVRALSRLRRISRTRLENPRLQAMADLMLSIGHPDRTTAALARLDAATDPSVTGFANLVLAQVAENAGDLEAALQRGHRSFELSTDLHDTWSSAAAAQALAQLYAQLARHREALEWIDRARHYLSQIQADSDLRQLDWLTATSSIALGEFSTARSQLEFFAYDDQDPAGFDARDLRAIGLSGLAEIALLAGETETGLDLYRRAVDSLGAALGGGAPWRNLVSAGSLLAEVRAGVSPAHRLRRDAASLRVRLIVAHRLMPQFVDKPVLGVAALALGVWMLDESRSKAATEPAATTGPGTATETHTAVAFELIALAARLNSRQDLPSLEREPIEAAVRAEWGDERLDMAARIAQQLSREQAAERTIAVLREHPIPLPRAQKKALTVARPDGRA